MQRDAGVYHPGRAGVPEAVSGEVGQAEIADDLVPVRRVPHGRGRESTALRADQQPVLGLLPLREPLKNRAERVEDRDAAFSAAFGLFRDEPAFARVGLPCDDHDVLVEPDVTGLKAVAMNDQKSPERVPGARPARLPTVETSWQGNPPQSTSTGGTALQSMAEMSPRFGTSGQW